MASYLTHLIYLLLLIPVLGWSQQLQNLSPELTPLTLSVEGEKLQEQEQAACEQLHEKMAAGIPYDSWSAEEQEQYDNCAEEKQDYWDIFGTECSWYCGGGPIRITASSFLPAQGSISYNPENADDLNYKTAWAEGVPGYGIGESLTYYFKAYSPRITEVIVVNGYIKSEAAWKNNSRVKKLKLYVDEKPFAILNLADTRSEQRFTVGKIGKKGGPGAPTDAPLRTLKFEILEVYEGDKYDDVVISEIYFNGIDVHCLGGGTLITMADGSTKKIEELQVGERVLSQNRQSGQLEGSRILELAQPVHCNLVELSLSDGSKLVCTQDHPLLQSKGSWASLAPAKTETSYEINGVEALQTGTRLSVLAPDQSVSVVAIQPLAGAQTTYTIVQLENGNRFVANGIWVGTEQLRPTAWTLQLTGDK